ncbi:MAG: ComEC/Rec2 family competence protein [Chloroflexota bacterium]
MTAWSRLRWLVPLLLLANLVAWMASCHIPDDRLHVSFLNVGQGDAALIQTPGRHTILIDGGPDPERLLVELGRKMPFWTRRIDLVIATQGQTDHIAGLNEILRRYAVRHVLEPAVYPSQVARSPACREWCAILQRSGAERHVASAGQHVDLGDGISLEVISPPAGLLTAGSDRVDNNGTVMRLSWGEISFLFCADIRTDAEFELVSSRAELRSTVLKVAHHGSRTSSSEQFLRAVQPDFAVISAGADNAFGHPHPDVTGRLGSHVGEDHLFLTPEHGTITFTTDGTTLWSQTGIL